MRKMAAKIAVRSGRQRSMRECTFCKGYADTGFFLHGDNSVQFVCEECYQEHFLQEYPLVEFEVRISEASLGTLFEESGKQGLRAGYLLGKRTQTECPPDESSSETVTVTVSELLPVLKEGNGHIIYFTPEDYRNIKNHLAGKDIRLVGLYRTAPSGDCSANSLDQALAQDLKAGMVYLVIAGEKQGMISGMCKGHDSNQIGVVIE